jgi:lipopolysaccharide/colanic/teichoic acid biosynthesis glycosyltransferase
MRLLDLAIAAFGLLVAFPAMVLVAVVVKLQDGGPIFFRHMRLGRGGEKFPCLKFRTMVVDAQARLTDLLERDPAARQEWERDHKLRKDPRVTLIGKFLRSSSLDELPQLINVLRGEMSLVGPRPIVDAEVARYGRFYRHYCALRPGITGLWQVSGRNDVEYSRRIAFDVLYGRKRSLWKNLEIIVMTIPAVLLHKGSY